MGAKRYTHFAYIYYQTVSVGQEFRYSLAKSSASRYHKVAIKASGRAGVSSEAQLEKDPLVSLLRMLAEFTFL